MFPYSPKVVQFGEFGDKKMRLLTLWLASSRTSLRCRTTTKMSVLDDFDLLGGCVGKGSMIGGGCCLSVFFRFAEEDAVEKKPQQPTARARDDDRSPRGKFEHDYSRLEGIVFTGDEARVNECVAPGLDEALFARPAVWPFFSLL
jgi:hypothetical protein